MARDFGPFPSKLMYEVVNRRMQKALAEASSSTGFVKTGQGAIAAGTGAELVIAAYPDGALIDGLYVENPASETVTLSTNTASTNPRIDRLVMRLDMAAETIAPFQIVGTPAASPAVPPLVQTATVYDMPLCQYRFPGSASAQNPGSIVDERMTIGSGVRKQTTRTGAGSAFVGTPWDGSSPLIRQTFYAEPQVANAGGGWSEPYPEPFPNGVISLVVHASDTTTSTGGAMRHMSPLRANCTKAQANGVAYRDATNAVAQGEFLRITIDALGW